MVSTSMDRIPYKDLQRIGESSQVNHANDIHMQTVSFYYICKYNYNLCTHTHTYRHKNAHVYE